ncbi:uncharacterized protein LOC110687490 [Chenopodium quinoa]|uniref:uncharacterized protein LOC110687490 n=1 Tax=Chenopodium quinoa TaxID=63459 RepID=UPI000B76C82F|nr:uncharacterized protein LOC110687490 [Chenopodium quinoa]
MTKFCANCDHNILVMLLAALIFASVIVNSQCRPVASNEIKEEEDDDESLEMKWVLEMSSRDEMVQMAGYGEEKLSTVLITGSVICYEACLAAKHGNHHQLKLPPQPISGALVGAECQANKKVKSPSWAKTVTDEYGEFMIELPSNLHGIPNLDKKCSVKILELPKDSPCHLSTVKNKEIKLSSVGNGIRTYTTGKIELLNIMPEKSEACMKGQKDDQGMSW